MPAVSMEQPVKVATPLVAAVGVQVSVPGPPVAGVAAVIERASPSRCCPSTVLFPASWTVTAGCVTKAVPPVATGG